jgi:predicted dehydrogenase
MKMKIAVFGVWHVHAPDYTKKAMELGQVVGFYERDEALASDFAKRFDIPRFKTAEELLESDAEGVIVCSASSDHCEDMIRIANAKKHIFTEKVLALTDEECDGNI